MVPGVWYSKFEFIREVLQGTKKVIFYYFIIIINSYIHEKFTQNMKLLKIMASQN